jgi:hypothetical protein
MAIPIKLSGLGKQANALARNAQSQAASSIDAVKSSLGFSKKNAAANYLSSQSTDSYVFPIDLRGQPNVSTVKFTAYDKGTDGVKQHSIFFPCPANISINDSATYNIVDLGTVGGAVSSAMQKSDSLESFAKNIAGEANTAKQNFKTGQVLNAAIQKSPLIPDSIKGASKLASRSLTNPNSNTTFSGNAIRSFTFSFKMVANSAEEAELVRKIHSKFRKFAYADAAGTFLTFPPTWTITFYNGMGEENEFIPKIFSCYLVSVESTLNSTINMFHADGAPLEVDINISYQETRVLNRRDIIDLEEGSLGISRGINENGVPKTSGIVDANTKPTEQLGRFV